MKKSLIIDFELLNKLNIKVNHLLLLYNKYINDDIFEVTVDEEELLYLQRKLLIKIIPNDDIILRQEGMDLINMLIVDTEIEITPTKRVIKKSNRVINNDIESRVLEFRSLWKGLKPGSMGSLKACKIKLSRWMKENPEYTFDDIIKAAKLYLNTEGRNVRFLQRADYFIYKQENNREESSRLSAYIDDIGDDDSTEDWTSTLN